MFRIKKLDIFIAKQFGLLFIATFFICQFVLMMQFLWRYVDELIGKGLSLEILVQFFWYMALMLMPQAFPLAILLSSLITFGNLGESCELTAIKAAGISLMQAFRSLIIIVILISLSSFYFQNVISPEANKNLGHLLLSMKQKSPELEIPEGIFYDGIPNCNLYVKKKDLNTGKLYDIMIYRMNGGYEDAAIILADSGMLQSTAEKKHLLLTLYSGEWFENMKSQDMAGSASVPYRRETFITKQILLDFDGSFNMADVAGISASASSKNIVQIYKDLDSMYVYNDSVGRAYHRGAQHSTFFRPRIKKEDSTKVEARVAATDISIDTIFNHLSDDEKREVMRSALSEVRMTTSELDYKGSYTSQLHRNTRRHEMEAINKFTLSLQCLLFFFIGAPLGAIIRKGGLGVPVIISVMVFITYYIFDNSGMRMARNGEWTVWYGKWIALIILSPLAIFFTYKANKDSTVFNIDAYKNALASILGIRSKRHVMRKEVIINDPAYSDNAAQLAIISEEISEYSQRHSLLKAPNPIKVFFRAGSDRRIRDINDKLETVIEDLSNTKDPVIIQELNNYPIVATHAHTRPFRQKWLNIITGLILPLGIFFYLRMWRFRLRLYRDLRSITQTNDAIIARINERHIINNV